MKSTFVNDLGIRCEPLTMKKILVRLWKTLHELRRRKYSIYVGKLDDKEVDFIAINGDMKLYIQVTYLLAEESTIEREFPMLEAIDDNYPKNGDFNG